MCLLIFFLLLAPSFSFHTVPAFPPLQICVASRTLHFHHIISICIPLLSSSLPVLFAFSHLPVQMAIFSLLACLFPSAILTFSTTHAGREKKMSTMVFVTQPRHQTMPASLCPNPQIQKLCRLDDWLVESSSKLNRREQGSYMKRLPTNHRRGGRSPHIH